MTTREQWLALAERCEKATGLDMEINVTIQAYVSGWSAETLAYFLTDFRISRFDRYTASLDAITALIERELPKSSWLGGYAQQEDCDSDDGMPGGWGRLFPAFSEQFYPKGDEEHERFLVEGCATTALALCAAFCRVMAERSA